MTETEQKAAFAAFLLRDPKAPLEAALKLFPEDKDRGHACYVSMNWPNDPEVISAMADLRNSGIDLNGPSKSELVEEMWLLAQDMRYGGKERVAAAKLIAEIKGFISKENSDEVVRKVMPEGVVYKIVSE